MQSASDHRWRSAGGARIGPGCRGGRVEGVVTDDGKPTAGALVVVELGGHDPGKLAQTDRSGRFSVRGLAPGDYTVYACDVAPEGFNADPIGPEVYQDKAKRSPWRKTNGLRPTSP